MRVGRRNTVAWWTTAALTAVCLFASRVVAADKTAGPPEDLRRVYVVSVTAMAQQTKDDMAELEVQLAAFNAEVPGNTKPTAAELDQVHAASSKVGDDFTTLGILHAAAAAPLLAQNIAFQDSAVVYGSNLEASYPAYGALLQIGSPTFPALIDYVSNCDLPSYKASLPFHLVASVLKTSIGVNAAVAYVQDQLAHRTSPTEREKLTNLLETIRNP